MIKNSKIETGFIYLWYDNKRKMYYLGCHLGNENDGYICSSNRMRDAYRRRPDDFKRRILKRDISREFLTEEEHKWLSMISDNELGKKYYNLSKQHFIHWSWSTDENKRLTIRQKQSKAQTGKISAFEGRKHSEKSILKMSMAKKGKSHSTEHRQKIGKANSGKIPWNKGKSYSHKNI